MKGILEFNLDDPDERLEHKRAVNATRAYLALWEVGQQVFRPARKHGYSDEPKLNELLQLNGEDNEVSLAVSEAISILEKKFYSVLQEYVNLEDLD